MFKNALTHKQLQARTIVFDSWYGVHSLHVTPESVPLQAASSQ